MLQLCHLLLGARNLYHVSQVAAPLQLCILLLQQQSDAHHPGEQHMEALVVMMVYGWLLLKLMQVEGQEILLPVYSY